MTDESPRDITTVRDTYETIAVDFDRTRSTPWPAVRRFITGCDGGDVALDLGCGNGRHAVLFTETHESVIGIDLSPSLLEIARVAVGRSTFAPLEASSTAVPLRSSTVDHAVYIATIHHLPDRAKRVASLDELDRVLTPGGRALISGWSVGHDRFEFDTARDVTVDWTLPDGETVPRFYHIYDQADFASELAASKLCVDREWSESGNCYAVVIGSSE